MERVGTMQSNFDYEDYEVINMANTARNRRLITSRYESLKMKKAKHLKIVNKARFILSVGVLTVCVSSFSFALSGWNSNTLNNDILSSNQVYEPIVAQNIIDKEKSDINENTIEKQLLDKYCNIYSLNINVVYKLVQEFTNNFTNENYIRTNNPGFRFNNNSYDNKELGILCFIRHLYQIPEDFGLSLNEIKSAKYNEREEIREEYLVKQYSSIFGIDPVLVLAIEYQEASFNGERYASEVYKNYNNPAGLINPNTNDFWKFPSKEAGIIEHIYQLKNYYIDNNLTTPEQIQSKYAPNGALNDPNNLNSNWLINVKKLMEEIKNDSDIFNEQTEYEKGSFHKY